ncbi:MAG: hypothetical protein MJ220_03115 [Bacilli bacterium]|nr:hypothetical protein [Bacilli bacterium]
MKKKAFKVLSLVTLAGLFLTSCSFEIPDEVLGGLSKPSTSQPQTSVESSSPNTETTTINIAKAIELANAAGTTPTAAEYQVTAKVKSILNSVFGEMEIEDETGSIYVYGAYGKNDESISALGIKVGDTITLKGKLRKYGEKPGFATSTIVDTPKEDNPSTPAETTAVTIAKAIEIAQAAGETYTTEKYRITGTIKTVSNSMFGEMTIADETGELYVYGVYGADGTSYDKLEDRPVKGDTITVEGSVHVFKEKPEMGKATLVSFTHNKPTVSPDDYKTATIAEARVAPEESLLKVSGVVAQINVDSKKSAAGFLLVDNTGSIYVYDVDAAGQVAIGNKVTLAAEKVYFVVSSETANAEKWGYKGCNQLTNVTLLENDKGTNEFDKSVAVETTVKDVMNTPYSEDITGKLFKANALIKYAPGAGFNNVYINDIDGRTGSYVYTLCNGADLDWALPLDGKICETYFIALNAKSSATGCLWRFLPVQVTDKNYKFDTANAAQYALDYEVDEQFDAKYTADPATELITSVSSELLGFEGVSISYESSNTSAFVITDGEGGKKVLHTGTAYGKSTITITATYNGVSKSKTVELEYKEAKVLNPITVLESINTEAETEVCVKGVVTGSYTNKYGFFITDETGTIAVLPTDGEATSKTLKIGDEVIVTGKRATYKQNPEATNYLGQIQIESATVEENFHGNHQPSEAAYVTDKTAEEIIALTAKGGALTMQTKMFRAEFFVELKASAYSTNLNLKAKAEDSAYALCYSSSASQYKWLTDEFANKTVTVDLMLMNPNSKDYWRAVPVRATDGTTTVWNTLYCQAPTF